MLSSIRVVSARRKRMKYQIDRQMSKAPYHSSGSGNKKKDIHISLDVDVWRNARIKCLHAGLKLSTIIEDLLTAWVRDEGKGRKAPP